MRKNIRAHIIYIRNGYKSYEVLRIAHDIGYCMPSSRFVCTNITYSMWRSANRPFTLNVMINIIELIRKDLRRMRVEINVVFK